MSAAKQPPAAMTLRKPDEDAKAALISVPQTGGTGAALVADIRALVEPFGGIELELPTREPVTSRGIVPIDPQD